MTTKNKAAQALRSIPSSKRADTSRSNGAKGGRPSQEHSWWVGSVLYVLTPNPLEAFGAMRGYRLTGADDRSGLRTLDVTFDRNYGRTDGVIEDLQDWDSETGSYTDPAWYAKAPASPKRILKRFYTR